MFYSHDLSRRIGSAFLFLSFVLVVTQTAIASTDSDSTNNFASTISGIVYGPQNSPLSQIDVELSNEVGRLIARTKTDDIGRYQFDNLTDGRYKVKVFAFRYNLIDQTQTVTVHNISLLGNGSGFFPKDFYLRPKKGGLGDTTNGVVFVQKVPQEAEQLYKEAIKDVKDDKTTAAVKKLVKSLKIFPRYYAAAQLLGNQWLRKEEYLEATKLFMIAAESNPKSSRAFYFMGFSLNMLGKKQKTGDYNAAALEALKQAIVLAPASWKVVFLAGKIQREEKNYAEAEKHLLKAKKLARTNIATIHKELAELYGNDLKQYGKAADELELYLKSNNEKDKKKKKKIKESTKKIITDLRKKAKNNG